MKYVNGLYHIHGAQLQECTGDRIWPVENWMCIITQKEPLVNVYNIAIVGISIVNYLQSI